MYLTIYIIRHICSLPPSNSQQYHPLLSSLTTPLKLKSTHLFNLTFSSIQPWTLIFINSSSFSLFSPLPPRLQEKWLQRKVLASFAWFFRLFFNYTIRIFVQQQKKWINKSRAKNRIQMLQVLILLM